MNAAAPILTTPLTEMLGCKHPVIQTAMGWVSTQQLVTASIKAGAFGFLAAAVMKPGEIEAQINAIRTASDAAFGVNIHAFQLEIDRIIDLCIDHQIAAISYGRGPDAKLIERVKKAGIKCVPTIGAAAHAKKAVQMGADMLVCQGGEGGGHTGATPTWLLLAQVLDMDLGVPVVACGGFRDGRGLAAALTFGAVGIAMGTRFMLTSDSPTPDKTKQKYLNSVVTQIPVSTRLDGLPQRMVMNETLAKLERAFPPSRLLQAMFNAFKYRKQTGMSWLQSLTTAISMARKTDMSLAQTFMAPNAPVIIQKAMVEGKPDEGVLPSGQIAGLIDDLPSCEQLMQELMMDAKQKFEAREQYCADRNQS